MDTIWAMIQHGSKKVFEPLLKEKCHWCPFGSSPLICCMTENPSQTYLDVYSNINIISGLAYCTCTFLTHHHDFQEKSSIFMDVYMTLFKIHSSFTHITIMHQVGHWKLHSPSVEMQTTEGHPSVLSLFFCGWKYTLSTKSRSSYSTDPTFYVVLTGTQLYL